MLPESERSPEPITSPDTSVADGEPTPAKRPRVHRMLLDHVWPVVMLVLLIVAGGLLVWQHNLISDWLVIRSYHPSTTIQQLAADDTMTAYAKRMFYVNKPQLDNKTVFNQHCTNDYAQITVLGCWAGNRQGIFLYQVTDPELNGIEQVTGAHEMLHQAYQRLSSSEKAHVDAMMLSYYSTTGPAMHAEMASYQKIEPHSVMDEMHSVFGTEVANLPPDLEQYFSQYFSNRQKVVDYFTQYQAAFTQRQQQVSAYDSQITQLSNEITSNKATISSDEQSLEAQQQQMDADRSSNDISDYNAMVPGFNAQVSTYTTLVNQTNALINQSNSLITARNAIATQEQQLEQDINSQQSTATTQ